MNLLKGLGETAKTGFLTSLQVTERVIDDVVVDRAEQILLEQQVEQVLKSLCMRVVLAPHNSYEEGVCPTCQQSTMFDVAYYQELIAQPESMVSCYIC